MSLSNTAVIGRPPARATSVVGAAAVPLERWLFWVTAIFAGGLMWLAPRLPMTDLPQHAAQVTLWRDLILGTSPWSSLVRVNLLTPYLAGYGLTLPVSFLMPMHDAVRVVLTLAFYGFVAGCLGLRRSLGGDPRLDWLFLFGFFGFAWCWGFLTFLVAAPVALGVLLVAHRYAIKPNLGAAAALVSGGIVLLFCHGLSFLMTLGIIGLMALSASWRRGLGAMLVAAMPSLILILACAAFKVASQHGAAAMAAGAWVYDLPAWQKPIASLVYVSAISQGSNRLLLGLTAFLLYAPRLLGSRINGRLAPCLFAGLALTVAVLPSYAFGTALLYQRFSLFLLPFYALMFRPAARPDLNRRWKSMAVIAATWLMLGAQALHIKAFEAEARPFETVLAAAEPGRRALAFVYRPESEAAGNAFAYQHFPAWYGAEKGGFVDFNFARFAPEVVRFRPEADPGITDAIVGDPDQFALTRAALGRYAYIFVRGSADDVAGLLRKSPCRLTVRAADGPWALLEIEACKAG